jgi:TolB protein
MALGRKATLLILFSVFLIGCGGKPSGPDGGRREIVLFDREPDWSSDGGKIVYLSKGDPDNYVFSGLYVVGVETRKRRRIIGNDTDLHGPRWNPSGDWVVFSRYGKIYKTWHRGGEPIQLTFGPGDLHPSWSPDGQYIMFGRTEGPDAGIYRITSEGDSPTFLLAGAHSPDWFPDGRHLAVLAADDLGQTQIARFSLENSSLEFLTTGPANSQEHLRVSPDGTRVMYAKRAGESAPRLFIVNVDSKKVEKLSGNGGFTGTWSPDGNAIAYDDPFDGAIYIRDLLDNTEFQISPGIKSQDPVWDTLYIEQNEDAGP